MDTPRLTRALRSLVRQVAGGILARSPGPGRRAPEPAPARSPRPRGRADPSGRIGDGRADPGEIVWAWIPFEEDVTRGKDRPALVVRREGEDVLVLPVTSKDHDVDAVQEARAGRHWMDIGSGAWDRRGRPSEVRLDRLVRIPDGSVRREGAVLEPALFARVLAAHERYA